MLRIFIGICYLLVVMCLIFAAAAAFAGDWGNFLEMLAAASKLCVSILVLTLVSGR